MFYGQAQRFAYFAGCSGGGREVLIEIQRYPADFDGVAVGAPNILLSVHSGGGCHGWQAHINERPGGSLVLARDRLDILHAAVIAHCARVADAMDGVLQMTTACRFDPAWVRCPAGPVASADTAKCLRPDELTMARQLYEGATDANGRGFDAAGCPPGSERLWPMGLRVACSRGSDCCVGDWLIPIAGHGGEACRISHRARKVHLMEWRDR